MARVPEGSKTERFGYIAEHRAEFGIRYLCRRLGVSPAGFYKWMNRTPSQRERDNRLLAAQIDSIFSEHRGNYGSPRVYKALRKRGETVNHKRVERIMQDAGLVGKAGRLYRRKALPENPCNRVGNIKRDLGAPTGPNEQWAGDVTYLKVKGEWHYLAVILDLYSRRVIGWELGVTRGASLTHSALKKALRHREVKPGLIFHSDRGSEYGAYLFQDELRKAGIRPSMNRPNHMTDNAHVESFFKTLKTESFHGISFSSVHELRMTLSWYMEVYYNTRRLHTSLGFNVPDDYERMAA